MYIPTAEEQAVIDIWKPIGKACAAQHAGEDVVNLEKLFQEAVRNGKDFIDADLSWARYGFLRGWREFDKK